MLRKKHVYILIYIKGVRLESLLKKLFSISIPVADSLPPAFIFPEKEAGVKKGNSPWSNIQRRHFRPKNEIKENDPEIDGEKRRNFRLGKQRAPTNSPQ